MNRATRDQTTPSANSADVTDADLVGRLQQRDPAAFRILMQRHNRRLYRMARGVLRDPAEAEDAVQDAYVLVFTNIDRIRDASNLGAWLGRIVLNEALRRLRPRRLMTDFDDGQPPAEAHDAQIIPFPGPFPGARQPPATPEEDAARAEVRRLLERAVDRLPGPFRVVFVLRDIEQMSVEETASVLGIPAETVKTRLHRARRLLGRNLRRQLSPDLIGAFPFAGARCARIVARVLDRLGLPEPNPEP
ncbi:RNA polymerase sigma factor [Azospirillum sp. sgz302134]